MIHTIAVEGYRSLRDLKLPLGQLNLITGANGSGKSSVYRSLRLLADVAQNQVVASLAFEGGLPSTFWAGPEVIARSVRQGIYVPQGQRKEKPSSLKLGFGSETYSYSVDLGYPQPLKRPLESMFKLDPHIKRECVWQGPTYRKAAAMVDRRNNVVWFSTTKDEEPVTLTKHLADTDSMFMVADPQRAPEMLAVREMLRGWRFYDHFRTDAESPTRIAQIGTFSPVLNHDGSNMASALQTIIEIRPDEAIQKTIEDAFPGSQLSVGDQNGRFELQLRQHGLLRPLSAVELSDGTLRYLLWTAALLTPRPPALMVLNEPETSLHPDLLPALGRLIRAAAEQTQIIVVSHAPPLIETLMGDSVCRRLHLSKDFGETTLDGATLFNTPKWSWPTR